MSGKLTLIDKPVTLSNVQRWLCHSPSSYNDAGDLLHAMKRDTASLPADFETVEQFGAYVITLKPDTTIEVIRKLFNKYRYFTHHYQQAARPPQSKQQQQERRQQQTKPLSVPKIVPKY